MRLRITGIVVVAALLAVIAVASTAFKAQNNQNSQQEERQLPVVVTEQLQPNNGVVPVELECGSAELTAPNKLERVPCVIRNNTSNYITAAAVAFTVIIEKNGKTSSDSAVLTLDTSVHPDLHAAPGNNFIPPGEERSIEPLPVSYDAVIKGVTMRVDYVEFADHTMLGPNQAGSRIITEVREGAAKYKDWLVQQYNQSGKSINALAPLLEKSQPLPAAKASEPKSAGRGYYLQESRTEVLRNQRRRRLN